MSTQTSAMQNAPPAATGTTQQIQRACACGEKAGISGQCPACDLHRRYNAPTVQTRLRVGDPGDRYEQEADRTAEQVMRIEPAAGKFMPVARTISPLVQQKEVGEQDEDEITAVQTFGTRPDRDGKCRKAHGRVNRDGVPAVPDFAAALSAARGGGAPLKEETREFFEPRFGADFSDIRVHTDPRANRLAHSIHAHAFTHGRDIYFASGSYDPDSTHGRRLIAHELTHTVQQGRGHLQSGPPAVIQRNGPRSAGELGSGAPDEELREARAHAEALASMDRTILDVRMGWIPSETTQGLIWSAESAFNRMEALSASEVGNLAPRMLSSRALYLMEIFGELETRAQLAERDTDGTLLYTSEDESPFSQTGAAGQPWTRDRPQSAYEVPPFDEYLDRIDILARQEAQLRELEEADKRAQRGRPPPPQRRRMPGFDGVPQETVEQLNRGERPPTPNRNRVLSASPAASTGSQVVTGQGTVADALRHLRSKSYSDIAPSPERAARSSFASGKLIDHVAEIWFLSNRLYILDTQGRLRSAQGSTIRLRGLDADPGATYFVEMTSRFTNVGGVTMTGTYNRVDASEGQSAVRFAPASFLQGMVPIMDRARAVASEGKAVAIIAGRLGERTGSLDEGVAKFVDALGRVPGFMVWAVKKVIGQKIENPGDAVADVAVDLGIEYVAKRIPVVGAAAIGYQALDLAAWFGDTGNIAVYARTDEELNFAAQAFALRIADEVISEMITMGVTGAAGRLRSRGAPDVSSAPPSGEPSTPGETGTPATREQGQGDTPVRPEPAPEAEVRPPDTPPAAESAPAPAPATTAPAPAPSRPAAPAPAAPPVPRARPPSHPPPSSQQQRGPDGQPAQGAATGSVRPESDLPHLELAEVVASDGGGFRTDAEFRNRLTPEQQATLNNLQQLYDSYKNGKERDGAIPLPPDAWLLSQTNPKSRALQAAQSLLGADYRQRTRQAARQARIASERATRTLDEFQRPDTYTEQQVNQDLDYLDQHSDKLFDRLRRLRDRGLSVREITNGVFNILKGNIGEVLALRRMREAMEQIHTTPDPITGASRENARIIEGVRIQRVRPDGSLGRQKLFTDGIVGEITDGVLNVYAVFEIKSGSRGRREASSQFFEWREGRLEDGDIISVIDPDTGERASFRYAPDERGSGRVVGLQSSTPYVIAPEGARDLSPDFSETVARPFETRSLERTAAEIEFLARSVLERLVNMESSGEGSAP